MIKQRNDNLTKNEELALGEKIQKMNRVKEEKGLNPDNWTKEDRITVLEGEDALSILIGNYVNLARNIAHQHHKRTGTRYDIEDLLQDAIGALVESAKAYDPSKNCKLGTYAYYGITKKVSTTINYQRLVRMPENKMGEYILITRAQKAYNELTEEEQDKYSSELEYVYKHVDIKKEEIDLILENMQPQVSLNAEIYDGDGQLMDIIEDEDAEEEIKAKDGIHENLEKIISQLTPFQKDLVAYEFEVFPASMPYDEFLEKHDLTDTVARREARKVVTVMSNIAKRDNITVEL